MSSSKTKLATAAAVGSLAHVAGAAIVSADFSSSPVSIGTSGTLYFDFDTATAATSAFAGADGSFYFSNTNSEKPAVNSGTFYVAKYLTPYAVKLEAGSAIFTSSSSTFFIEYNGAGPWNAPTDGTGYLGFTRNNGNQGWLYIDYNDAADTITLLGMGYNDSGTLTAGQTSAIPEPAAATALAALLAGGVAAFQRRRRAA